MEMRTLKRQVETRGHNDELTVEYFKKVDAIIASLVSQGMTAKQARLFASRWQEQSYPKITIEAGEIVKAWEVGWWGAIGQDPNPLLLVEASDGRYGYVKKNSTDPA